jgi:hypothetical protein
MTSSQGIHRGAASSVDFRAKAEQMHRRAQKAEAALARRHPPGCLSLSLSPLSLGPPGRLAGVRGMSEWQPIKTAPRDGSDFLVFQAGGGDKLLWPDMISVGRFVTFGTSEYFHLSWVGGHDVDY